MLFTPSSRRVSLGLPPPWVLALFLLPPSLSIKAFSSSLGLALGQVLPRVSLALVPGAGRAGASASQRRLRVCTHGAARCVVAGSARVLPTLAHGEDARGVVAGAVQQAVEPALECRGDTFPLAQREDAGGMVAHAVQEVIDVAGAGLLPAALGQTLPGSSQGAEQEQEQEAGSSLELLEQWAALVQGSSSATEQPALPTGVSPVCPGHCSAAVGSQPHSQCTAAQSQPPSPSTHGPQPHCDHQPDVGALTSTRQPQQTPSPCCLVPEHPHLAPQAPCVQLPPEEPKQG